MLSLVLKIKDTPAMKMICISNSQCWFRKAFGISDSFRRKGKLELFLTRDF